MFSQEIDQEEQRIKKSATKLVDKSNRSTLELTKAVTEAKEKIQTRKSMLGQQAQM